jgi:hypothetical protein
MATPAQTGFFESARVTGLMQGLTDPRLLPVPLTWNQRIPDVPSFDEEVTAKYVGTLLIADLIADDQKAVTYSAGTLPVPGRAGAQHQDGHRHEPGDDGGDGAHPPDGRGGQTTTSGFFNDRFNKMVADAKYGVELRKEVLKIAMLLDGWTYDRLGIKMSGVTWGMYTDLKVTPSIAWTSTSATPLTDIATVRAIAQQRYGINLDRATMTTPQLRAIIATTEYQNQVKNVNFALLLGAPTQTAPLTPDTILRRQAEMIISGGTGEPFAIELDDRRYWAQDASGAITSQPLHAQHEGAAHEHGQRRQQRGVRLRQLPGRESALTGTFPSSVVGNIAPGRGPIGYVTLADQSLNPPGIVLGRRPRRAAKAPKRASAVLSVGTPARPTTRRSRPRCNARVRVDLDLPQRNRSQSCRKPGNPPPPPSATTPTTSPSGIRRATSPAPGWKRSCAAEGPSCTRAASSAASKPCRLRRTLPPATPKRPARPWKVLRRSVRHWTSRKRSCTPKMAASLRPGARRRSGSNGGPRPPKVTTPAMTRVVARPRRAASSLGGPVRDLRRGLAA